MKIHKILITVFFPLFLLTCMSNDNRSLIIGKWKQIDGSGILEFFKDGTVNYTLPSKQEWGAFNVGVSSHGTVIYKFIDNKHITLLLPLREKGGEKKYDMIFGECTIMDAILILNCKGIVNHKGKYKKE